MSRKSKKLPQINDSSKLKSIQEIIPSLEDINYALNQKIVRLEYIIEQLKTRNAELELIVSKSIPIIVTEPTEKEIAELQLEKLKQKALTGELTLEEARKFEIFSKIKIVVEENFKSKELPSRTILPSGLPELLQIASSNESVEKKAEVD